MTIVELMVAHSHGVIAELAHDLGLKIGDFEPNTATARFIEYEGKQVDAVRHFGRLADLICVPQFRS